MFRSSDKFIVREFLLSFFGMAVLLQLRVYVNLVSPSAIKCAFFTVEKEESPFISENFFFRFCFSASTWKSGEKNSSIYVGRSIICMNIVFQLVIDDVAITITGARFFSIISRI